MQFFIGILCIIISVVWGKIEREQKIKEVNEYMEDFHKAREEYKKEVKMKGGIINE